MESLKGTKMALSPQDRMAILDLVARYSHAWDYHDVEAWLSTFTADGVLTDGRQTFRGTEELRAFAEHHARSDLPDRQWTSNHVIAGDGETATHSCYLLIVKVTESPTVIGAGIYHDQLCKVDGEWKFVRREVTRESPR
jgi:uncharacterized protein (TIGR02246 family)